MGIPAFFRWLVDKYGNIIHQTQEPRESDGSRIRCNNAEPNANGEYDNLYLDMNGIIHPCAHPEQGPKPKNTQDMMDSIIEYLDLLFAIVRPRKLIYMAIDGVAPRAKMNQQRARRFRSALDSRIDKQAKAHDLFDQLNRGHISQEVYDATVNDSTNKYHFDSNCITPGTEFMDLVALTLRQYVAEKLSTDPAWKDLTVIISDASVPGEGEHKIMEYIRHQRSHPDYNPNLNHVMYGLDADLIMLALSTHEVNFDILREFVAPPKRGGGYGSRNEKTPSKEVDADEVKDFLIKNYQLLNLSLLREYLDAELKVSVPFGYDVERIIDDFIFICFFVGNDFLPHLPSLQINEGAIDRLMRIYKELLPSFDDYLTENGEINFFRLGKMFAKLGSQEDEILDARKKKEERFARRMVGGNQGNQNGGRGGRQDIVGTPQSVQLNTEVTEKHQQAAHDLLNELFTPAVEEEQVGEKSKKKQKTSTLSNKDAAQQIKEDLAKAISSNKDGNAANREAALLLQQKMKTYNDNKRGAKLIDIQHVPVEEPKETKKRKEREDTQSSEPKGDKLFIDKMKDVLIGVKGWRGRYYRNLFEVEENQQSTLIRNICQSYIDGLAWVLKYYYKGCASWGWYYPYHYAPFSMDLAENNSLLKEPEFELGSPFKPFQQLMSVLPKDSGQFVPEPYRKLMGITEHGESPDQTILHFYPTEFLIDVQPGKPTWKGVCQLPFINEVELLDALKPLDNSLTKEEKIRNSHGSDLILVNESAALASTTELPHTITKEESNVLGDLSPVAKDIKNKLPNLQKSKAFAYKNPEFPKDFEFTSGLLKGAKLQPKKLTQMLNFRNQNAAGNRMMNNAMGSNQYKNNDYRNQYDGQQQQQQQQYNQNYNQDNNQGNQNYNQNYNQNQNQNYNQNFNQGNQNQNYNQNQNQNQNYNQGNQNYNQGNQNYNQQFNNDQQQMFMNNMMVMMKQYNDGGNNMTQEEYNQMSMMMNQMLQQQQMFLQQQQQQQPQQQMGNQNYNQNQGNNSQFNLGRNTQQQGGNRNYNQNRNNNQQQQQGGNRNYNQGNNNQNRNNNQQQQGGNRNYNNNNQNRNNNQQQQQGVTMKYNPFGSKK